MKRHNRLKITRLYPICPTFAYIDLLDNENNTICITEDYIEIRSPCIDSDYLHGFIRQILIWINGMHSLFYKRAFCLEKKSRVAALHELIHLYRLCYISTIFKIQMFTC